MCARSAALLISQFSCRPFIVIRVEEAATEPLPIRCSSFCFSPLKRYSGGVSSLASCWATESNVLCDQHDTTRQPFRVHTLERPSTANEEKWMRKKCFPFIKNARYMLMHFVPLSRCPSQTHKKQEWENDTKKRQRIVRCIFRKRKTNERQTSATTKTTTAMATVMVTVTNGKWIPHEFNYHRFPLDRMCLRYSVYSDDLTITQFREMGTQRHRHSVGEFIRRLLIDWFGEKMSFDRNRNETEQKRGIVGIFYSFLSRIHWPFPCAFTQSCR